MKKPTRGVKFNRLTFVGPLQERDRSGHRLGLWECDCGEIKAFVNCRVIKGDTRSCGCLKVDNSREAHTRHGMYGTPTYYSWRSMIERCENQKSKAYRHYGAKGITVCARWRESFQAFLEDAGERPPGTTLDRFPNNKGNYEPGNVRWATPAEQGRNRVNLVFINSPRGIEPLIDYAAHIGVLVNTAYMRLRAGKLEGCTRA
jgi:hypothetical protein